MSVRVFISSKLPDTLRERLSARAEVLDIPLIKTEYLDFNPLILEAFQPDFIVFTSKNGVKAFFSKVNPEKLRGITVISVGKSTANFLKSFGIDSIYPEEYSANGLISMFKNKNLVGKRFLIVRPKVARKNFVEFLKGREAVLEEIIAYETVPELSCSEKVCNFFREGVDFAAFTSPSNFNVFLQMVKGNYIEGTKLIPIGTTTEKFIRESGFPIYKLPDEFSLEGIVNLIEEELKFK